MINTYLNTVTPDPQIEPIEALASTLSQAEEVKEKEKEELTALCKAIVLGKDKGQCWELLKVLSNAEAKAWNSPAEPLLRSLKERVFTKAGLVSFTHENLLESMDRYQELGESKVQAKKTASDAEKRLGKQGRPMR